MIWDLDKDKNLNDVKNYCRKNGYDKNTHDKFKIGQKIKFYTGHNDDILATATIKGFDNDNGIYVYTDCYWFPIKDNDKYKITV